MKYKNFVFDLYGTLIDVFTDDDSPKTDEAMAAFFAEHGAPYSPEEFGESFRELRRRQSECRMGSVYVPTGERICYPETDVVKMKEI